MRYVRRIRRRGAVTVQWVLLAAVVTLVVIASVASLGTESNTRLEDTAGGVGNPTNLKDLVK